MRAPDLKAAAQGVATFLRALGFDVMARANNHAMDWGVTGLRETSRALAAVGLAHAGAGGVVDERVRVGAGIEQHEFAFAGRDDCHDGRTLHRFEPAQLIEFAQAVRRRLAGGRRPGRR